ncbi:MAG: hypothetical protein WC741_02255 [Patescibacteria group bacterium]|jgi:hypothetical protein
MDLDEIQFSIKIFERGGLPYRDYTPASLKKLFIDSKTGANFELLAIIEGLTYFAYFIYCNINNQSKKYESILKNPIKGSFKSVINYLCEEGIIDKELQKLLQDYREKRNVVVHNWLQLKTPLSPTLKEYSHDEALGELFKAGMKTLGLLHRAIVPSKNNWPDYVARFKGSKKIKINKF